MKTHFKPYSKSYPFLFKKEKASILKLGNFEIHHIGSTAIPGMPGKGEIDILIILDTYDQRKKLIKKLMDLGYKKSKIKNRYRVFLTKFPYNLHLIVKSYGKARNQILFRDLLRQNKVLFKNYLKLKKEILKKAGNDRIKYRKLKRKLIHLDYWNN